MHAARQEGLRIEFAKIEAPLLRPVVMHKLRIASQPRRPVSRDWSKSPRVELDLNLAAIFSRARGRVLRTLTAEGIAVDIRRRIRTAHLAAFRLADPRAICCRTISSSPESNFMSKTASTIVDLHNGTLSGAQIEAGVFSASEITIDSPWFRKSFSQLRGATSWQESRLSVGAITLTRGLDLDAVASISRRSARAGLASR